MNQLLTDGRTMEGIVSSIIRQEPLRLTYSRLDWERIYRLADYHKVANIVYLGVLGYRESLPEKWQGRFFERYQESLLYGTNYKESVQEVLEWLDKRNVSCVILFSEVMREFYRIPEAADTSPLSIYLNEGSYNLAKGYLVDLGYEVDQICEGLGERFSREASVSVMLYYKLPFRTGKYARSIQKLLENACVKESYNRIRVLTIEGEYLFRMASAVYRYVTDELTIREVLELQLYHGVLRDRLRADSMARWLKDLQIDQLSEKLLRISYMWFADRKDQYYDGLPENMSEYDILEERLLTRGMINHETDEQALKLAALIRKELDKEKREEKLRQLKEKIRERWENVKRVWRWVFPDYHYMASIYLTLEKLPVLLPVFWVIRGVRLLGRAIRK